MQIKTVREFVELASSDDDRAKTCVAEKSLWLEIARDHPGLKEIAIHNKNSPILEEMSKDDNPMVRSAVARQRRCPHGLLECLANDLDCRVRLSVASNGVTPDEILERLRMDANPLVAGAAKREGCDGIFREAAAFLRSRLKISWIQDDLMKVYLRKSTRWIDGDGKRFIDIANVEVWKPGRGVFRRFLAFLHRNHEADGIFIECVVNPEFAEFCSRFASIVPMCEELSPSFYLMKNDPLPI